MKIAKNESEAYKLANEFIEKLVKSGISDAFIDTGCYKGGIYDCLFILHPKTGVALFEIAY